MIQVLLFLKGKLAEIKMIKKEDKNTFDEKKMCIWANWYIHPKNVHCLICRSAKPVKVGSISNWLCIKILIKWNID